MILGMDLLTFPFRTIGFSIENHYTVVDFVISRHAYRGIAGERGGAPEGAGIDASATVGLWVR